MLCLCKIGAIWNYRTYNTNSVLQVYSSFHKKKTGQWSIIEVDVYLVVTYVVNKAPIYMS